MPFAAVVIGLGLAAAETAAADQWRQVQRAHAHASTLRPGLIRRDAEGRLVLDTSAEGLRLARRQQEDAGAGAAAPCTRGGPLDARARAPGWIRGLVDEMAPAYRLDPDLVVAVMAVESNFRHEAVSPKNAQGLMQLIPATARRFGVSQPFDPSENLRGGMRYLRWLLDHFDGDLTLALAGYNAGEEAVARHGGVPPYRETQHYVRAVQRLYGCSPKGAPPPPAGPRRVDVAADFGVEQSAWPPVRPAGELWVASGRERR